MQAIPVRPLLLAAALAFAGTASAQSLDSLKSAAGGLLGQHGSTSALPSLSSLGSAQNAAGVLGYCQSHGYLPSATDTLKEKLLGKFGGAATAKQDSGYQQGLGGILQAGNGKSFDLGSLKSGLAKQACKHVADKAVSSFPSAKKQTAGIVPAVFRPWVELPCDKRYRYRACRGSRRPTAPSLREGAVAMATAPGMRLRTPLRRTRRSRWSSRSARAAAAAWPPTCRPSRASTRRPA